MSNKKDIKDSLTDFIINKSYDVAVLKGTWGIGKTFLWKEIESEIIKNKKFPSNTFMYISLFGMNDINEVKNKLIFSKKSTGWLMNTFKGLEDIDLAGLPVSALKYPVISLFEYMLNKKLKEKVIIFDDIERRSNEFNMLSFLGLINELKSKNNQIVIILNEEKILMSDNLSSTDWQVFKEKIIDIEFKLDVNEEDCLKIVKNINFNEYKLIRPIYKKILDRALTNLNCKNIRVLNLIFKRLYKILMLFREILNKKNKDDFEIILQNIAKMWFVYFDSNKVNREEIINYEIILKYMEIYPNIKSRNNYFYNKSNNLDPLMKDLEEDKIVNLLLNLDFNLNIEIVKIISMYIKTGYLDEFTLKNVLKNEAINIELEYNRMCIYNFNNDVAINKNITAEIIIKKAKFFSNLECSNYDVLADFYMTLKKIDNSSKEMIFDRLLQLMRERKWKPNLKILKDCQKIEDEWKEIQKIFPSELDKMSLLISYYSMGYIESVDNILNKLTVESLRDKLLNLNNVDLQNFLIFIKSIQGAERLKNFNNTFKNLYEDTTNKSEDKLKNIFLLAGYNSF